MPTQQPLQVGLPLIPNYGLDALLQAASENIDPQTSLGTIAPGRMISVIVFGVSDSVRVNLMNDGDFATASGDQSKFFVNAGEVYTKPGEMNEVIAAYREYQSQPDDDSRSQWLGGQGAVPQNIEDPSGFEFQIQFVAAAGAGGIVNHDDS